MRKSMQLWLYPWNWGYVACTSSSLIKLPWQAKKLRDVKQFRIKKWCQTYITKSDMKCFWIWLHQDLLSSCDETARGPESSWKCELRPFSFCLHVADSWKGKIRRLWTAWGIFFIICFLRSNIFYFKVVRIFPKWSFTAYYKERHWRAGRKRD